MFHIIYDPEVGLVCSSDFILLQICKSEHLNSFASQSVCEVILGVTEKSTMNFFSTDPPKDEDGDKMDDVLEKTTSTPTLTKDEVRNSSKLNKNSNMYAL
jgi:hypothetical protein